MFAIFHKNQSQTKKTPDGQSTSNLTENKTQRKTKEIPRNISPHFATFYVLRKHKFACHPFSSFPNRNDQRFIGIPVGKNIFRVDEENCFELDQKGKRET